MYKMILASQSPRRKKLLSEAGFYFTELPTQVSETPSKNLNPQQQILELAGRKAMACLEQNKHLKSQEILILAADTEVIFEGAPLGKPENFSQATNFLRRLSGKTHQVITALCLINCKTHEQVEMAITTHIEFRNLSEAEIKSYIETGEPFDKAGGYGIQGGGGEFVSKIDGPFDNVVGLPITAVHLLIEKLKVEVETSDVPLYQLKKQMSTHAIKKGIDFTNLKLIAVSKTKSVSEIEKVFSQGQRAFGENYVQELLEKHNHFHKKKEFCDLKWHFIGNLQTNKVNQVVGKVELIHSVDSKRLLDKIAVAASRLAIKQKVLLEVNIGDESTKRGFSVEGLRNEFSELLKVENVELCGLMALPPIVSDEQIAVKNFKKVEDLFTELKNQLPSQKKTLWTELSMGTTADFHLAIGCGATMLRIGTAIFGTREK